MNTRARTAALWILSTAMLLGGHLSHAADCRNAEPASLHDCLSHEGWDRKHHADGLSIYSRSHSGSDIREVLATTRIQAPAQDILTTLSDFNHYTEFMPSTLEKCEQLHREGDTYWVFQQLNLPFISDRYYTIRLQTTHHVNAPDWYTLDWSLAPEADYQRKGHGERVKFNNGYWSLREQPDGSTQVLYYIHTDPGHLWAWVVDFANRVAVPDVVKAVKGKFEKEDKPCEPAILCE